MKMIIAIVKPFIVNLSKVTLFPCKFCEAITCGGIVEVAYPHGPFALPFDKFNERLKDGSIVVEQVLN